MTLFEYTAAPLKSLADRALHAQRRRTFEEVLRAAHSSGVSLLLNSCITAPVAGGATSIGTAAGETDDAEPANKTSEKKTLKDI